MRTFRFKWRRGDRKEHIQRTYGGSWIRIPMLARVLMRGTMYQSSKSLTLGIRLVREGEGL